MDDVIASPKQKEVQQINLMSDFEENCEYFYQPGKQLNHVALSDVATYLTDSNNYAYISVTGKVTLGTGGLLYKVLLQFKGISSDVCNADKASS